MDEEDEAQDGASAHKWKYIYLARTDLAQVPPDVARAILTQYDPLVRGFVRRFPAALLGTRFDEDDLYNVGRAMLLQFWAIYDPERGRTYGGGSFQGWATFLFRQAFTKISRDLYQNPEIVCDVADPGMAEGPWINWADRRKEGHATAQAHVIGGFPEWARAHLAVEPEFEEALDEQRELARLDAALEALPARHRFILQGLREGRTSEAIAADLGLSRQRVDQIRVDAMRGLRVQLGLDDEDEEDDEDPEPARSPRRRLAATLTP